MKNDYNDKSDNATAIFIIPRSSYEWKGNEAGWITASGWAAAGENLWGNSIVATTDGVFSPEQSISFPRTGLADSYPVDLKKFRKLLPEIFITAFKDWKLYKHKPKVWPIEKAEIIGKKEVKVIWERHDLFPGPGRRIADKLGVPLITSVEALAVWEAKKWGVNRPFWGRWLEKNVEAASLRSSDLICCVSQEVKEKVIALGIKEEKILVTPNRVDSSLFHPNIDGVEINQKYNLKDKVVLGWTGSFRKFHGIDDVVKAFEIVHEQHPNTVLMLVGNGSEYPTIKERIAKERITGKVIMPGKIPFVEIPKYVSNFDISIVSAKSADSFHYSPLKLREYLAAGKAVVAPNAGNIPNIFRNGEDLLLYQAGNYKDLSNKILELLNNKQTKLTLESNAVSWFKREGSWTHELKRVCNILNLSYKD